MGATERYDHEEVKRRLRFLDLMAHEGIHMRRNGAHFIARCPFHEERSGSFTVHGPEHDHGHCYGCGWNGDIFDFWREAHGGGFPDALRSLASLASVSPSVFEAHRKQAAARHLDTTERGGESDADGAGQREKPTLPPLRALRQDELVTLAKLRKLDVEGIAAAARDKRVGACDWPQWQDHHGCWRVADDATPCWVVTDSARAVFQFRRLDGGQFERRDGKSIKAWTKGSPTWPLGANEIGERAAVLLVEGGADMLAAYHFLARFQQLRRVAVVAMLGASMRIGADALPFFARKRVRVFVDEDEPKGDRGIQPGCEAAMRWQAQLAGVGAAVEAFRLTGLLTKEGEKVKDMNDLAVVDEAAWLDDELRQAFFDFDF